VQVLKGKVSPPVDTELHMLGKEMLAMGYRLACRTIPLADCLVKVPLQSLSTPQRTQVEGEEIAVQPDPLVSSCAVSIIPPTLTDLTADAERLQTAILHQHEVRVTRFDINILRELSPELRQVNWHAKAAVREGEIVGLIPESARTLGLAVDLGTSKIAIYLMDLASGKTIAMKGLMNPQVAYGEDIIARMALANRSPEQAILLQELVVTAINEAVIELCAGVQTTPSCIVDSVLVANTAMHHLFLRLPVGQLARAPFIAAFSSALDVKARDVGLKFSPGAYVHLLPNIAGYVGADHVAVLLSTGMHKTEGVVLVLDIGTNTEICLANHHRLTSLSCASGPAFEGAHIKYGMRAADGAIEHVKLEKDKVAYQTIGGVAPVGLCGSGILDTLAQLFLAGVVDTGGKMKLHPRVREANGTREFVLVYGDKKDGGHSDITFTQRDVRELQLAKGAVRTGIEVLLKTNGLTEQDIDSVLVAGAFGSYIDIASAVAIGMLPKLPLERFRQVGNAAGMGAKLALISRQHRIEAQEIARSVHYIDLSSAPQFASTFNKAINLG
jgi:uncharacterized 2Fe-2S/4Fe-4S cluster protein (DUF4445 family)